MSNSVLSANIAALRSYLGLKQAAFAAQLDVDQSYISRWEKRGVEPSSAPLARMATLAGCSVEDFMRKPWSPPSSSTDALPVADTGDVVQIDKLDLSLSMGPGTLIDDWVAAEPVVFDLAFIRAITRTPPGRLKLVEGVGDSMYPTLNWGDAILVDTTVRELVRQDGIYWINLYGAAGIKRLRTVAADRVLVKSDNPAVDDQEVPLADLRIEGRAIWFARGL